MVEIQIGEVSIRRAQEEEEQTNRAEQRSRVEKQQQNSTVQQPRVAVQRKRPEEQCSWQRESGRENSKDEHETGR